MALEVAHCGLFRGLELASGDGDEYGDDNRIGGSTNVRPTLRQLRWPPSVSKEEKLRVTLNFLRIAGFEGLGGFLADIFEDKVYQDSSLTQQVSNFLNARSARPREHPEAILRQIYAHRQSQRWHEGCEEKPYLGLPRYALPPSKRFVTIDQGPQNSTRNAFDAWALGIVMKKIRAEAERLCELEIFQSAGTAPGWKNILSFDVGIAQEVISECAPILFSLLTTLAVNKSMAKKLDKHADNGTGNSQMKIKRDPWIISTITALMLLNSRHEQANNFQRMVGIFLYSCNANREILSLTSRVALSTSYSTSLRHLHALGKDAANTLLRFGQAIKMDGIDFLVLIDNINKLRRSWDASLLKHDQMLNGTAATLIKLEDVPDGALDQRLLAQHSAGASRSRKDLVVADLEERLDTALMRKLVCGVILKSLLKHVPALATRFRSALDAHNETHLRVHPLKVRKSEIYPMRTSNKDESTVPGIASVVNDLVEEQLGIDPNDLESRLLFLCGDLLSVDRARKLKEVCSKAPGARSCAFILALAQLFHLKWCWQKSIMSMHWWASVKGADGLACDVAVLGRGKFNHERCDFYPGHHILEDKFEAMVCHALRLQIQETHSVPENPDSKLLDVLERAFSKGGVLASCDFSDLLKMAETIYDRFCSPRSSEFASGELPRPEAKWGKPCSTYTLPSMSKSATVDAPKSNRGRKKARATNPSLECKGDQSLQNDCHFMRTTGWYLLICDGISQGDMGHVFCALDFLTFSFWGAGATNYANEMLEMACNFICEFPPELRVAIMNNYVVNPTGRPGHFQELDFLQEHFNKEIKHMFTEKAHDFGDAHIAEAIALNINGLKALRQIVAETIGVKRSGTRHAAPDKTPDINRLGAHYLLNHRLEYCARRTQPYLVPDEFSTGFDLLFDGQFDKFIERTAR
ncbi:hypothetical protein K523DRAFT_257456 [Schizophyllum commune Tattone D]|nr:hypothetical protein K523DRAFT_257456 [Schizophyllum commune Tattone D]